MSDSQPTTWKETVTGFIVHGFMRTIRGRPTLCLVGRCKDHRTFAALFSDAKPGFYVREGDLRLAQQVMPGIPAELRADRSTMDGEAVAWLSFANERTSRDATDHLRRSGVRTYEADIDTLDSFLMDCGIHGTLTMEGECKQGHRVDMVFFDPEVAPADWQPDLSVMSVDIETMSEGADRRVSRIMVIGYQLAAPWLKQPVREVLYAGVPRFDAKARSTAGETELRATYLESESELIATYFERVRELDPDIITGWNVIDFDWREIAARAGALGVEMKIGRSDEPSRYLPPRPAGSRSGSRRGIDRWTGRSTEDEDAAEEQNEVPIDPGPAATAAMFIPGRQVIDGIRLLRYGPQNFREQSLQYVAHAVLGIGKTIQYESSAEKLAEIERMSREDPEALCKYCLQDAVLVSDILVRTGLLDLTIMRCLLIGVSLSRAWMSIRSFDFIYIEAMHRRGIVAPTLGVDPLPLEGAPGGAILTPEPGLFDNVMVFDFKSLYPSVIRTFNIDPVGFAGDKKQEDVDPTRFLAAPNGATFARRPAILPELLDRFFSKREEAKQRGDQVASYVYKIIMNSFYGVLGAGGCRFSGTALAGAITGLGQKVLRWCKRLLVDSGYAVIYGDTDSLFVIAHNTRDSGDVFEEGKELARLVNRKLADFVAKEYGVQSRLELEFEKVYRHFFLPALRTQGPQDQERLHVRGRAKGYAGLIMSRPDVQYTAESGIGAPFRDRIEVKGMEAVRRDWTPLAQEFQLAILETLFQDGPLDDRRSRLAATVREMVKKMRSGGYDGELAYMRSLRKAVSNYTKSQPPHVKAALMLPPSERRGTIRYIMTKEGPQPVRRRTAPIDYEHYVEKQLRPIAQAFVELLGSDIVDALGQNRQLNLW